MLTEGSLQDFSLPDILQIISLQNATGTLTLRSEGRSGRLLFQNGTLRGAKLGGREGKPAACDMFLWSSGVFDFAEGPLDGAPEEEISLEELSRDGARLKDRWRRISEQLPGTFSHRTWIAPVKPPEKREGVMADVQSGLTFAEFVKRYQQGELSALEEVFRLVQEEEVTLHSSQEEQLRALFHRATDELFAQFASISGIKMIGILEGQLNDLAREKCITIRYRQGKVQDNLPDNWSLEQLLESYRPLFSLQQEYVTKVYGAAYVERVLGPLVEELTPQQRALWDKLCSQAVSPTS